MFTLKTNTPLSGSFGREFSSERSSILRPSGSDEISVFAGINVLSSAGNSPRVNFKFTFFPSRIIFAFAFVFG